jgi:hypothetical protein
MSSTDLEPLSPELESLLAKERNISPEGAELRARVMTRARAALETRATPAGHFWRRRATLLLAAALMTGFAAVAIAAWQGLDRSSGLLPSVLPPASGKDQTKARAPEPPLPAQLPQKSAAEPTRPEAGNVVTVPRPSSPSDVGDAYALELALLQRARAAVASGNFSTALDAIAEHQRRFPRGKLREEREALRVKALAGLGRYEEARRAAERFREHFPNSVLSPRIEATARPAP